MLVLIALSLTGCCLLISSGQGGEAGHRAWRQNSVLRVITELMTLNYQYPTPRGTAVKWLAQDLGAAAVLMAASIGWFLRSRREEDVPPTGGEPRSNTGAGIAGFFSSLTLTTAAQMAMLLFAGWAILSSLWAVWPEAARGEGFRQLIVVAWAVVLGRTLSAAGARRAAAIVIIVLSVTAGLGIWYHIERNPVQRLKFPIGNPIFLAACLLPGLLLAMSRLAVLFERRRPAAQAGSAPVAGSTDPAGGPGLPEAGAGDPAAPAGAAPVPASAADAPQPAIEVPRLSKWAIAGWVVCLALMSWAFDMADSRGPLVGLIFGFGVMVFLDASPRTRRLLLIAAVLGAIVVGYVMWPSLTGGSRGATTRLRLHAWSYALERFVIRPVTGTGQGGYLLGAHQMSLADAELDPAAFPAALLGHAHNEWLEILSDLGAAGFALISTAFGITFWAGALAIRRMRDPRDRWCLLALMGSLAGLTVEEATDVALRMPGLPLVFYTVLGLLWAMSRSTEQPAQLVSAGLPRPLRVFGLLAGGAAAVIAARVAIHDWQGALAHQRMYRLAGDQRWEDALELGKRAQAARLSAHDRVEAAASTARVARDASQYWLVELSGIAGRAEQAGDVSPSARGLAAEGAARFGYFFGNAMDVGRTLLSRMPYYPMVGGWLADVLLMKQQAEAFEQKLGLRKDVGSYVADARSWLQYEYSRNPLDAENALRLLQFSGDQPLADRLNLLRVPLRSGAIRPEVRPALAGMMREKGFEQVVNEWLAAAKAVLAKPTEAWADRYAPESLRLVALANELQQQYVGAAELSGHAVLLLAGIRERFPTAASHALTDQARYVLLAQPDQPQLALAAYAKAVELWPPGGADEEGRQVKQDMALVLLATGDEAAARKHLQAMNAGIPAEALDGLTAAYYAQLAQLYIGVPPDRRPERFGGWIGRALELDPSLPTTRLLAAQAALEQRRDDEVVRHLEAIEQVSNTEQLVNTLQFLMARFPRNAALEAFAKARFPQPGAEGQAPPEPNRGPPGATRPATRPVLPGRGD